MSSRVAKVVAYRARIGNSKIWFAQVFDVNGDELDSWRVGDEDEDNLTAAQVEHKLWRGFPNAERRVES